MRGHQFKSKHDRQNQSTQISGKIPLSIRYAVAIAGIRAISGPPGNQNAFRHRLASISQRRTNGDLNPSEQSIREKFLVDLFADK